MPADAAKPEIPDLLAELEWRGLIHQVTDREGLAKHLASGQRRVYAGFDPTADSLTIGNLVPTMMLRHVQRAGHTPVVVMGGGTGLIGDPSGKSAERELMTEERVAANVESQRRVFGRILEFKPAISNPALLVNNLDWLGALNLLDALRLYGKYFSVNTMIQKDSVRERLHNRDQGISFTEFSYQILQAIDFYRLFKHDGVTVQFGGSDQWGNIVAGIDLIRRVAEEVENRALAAAGGTGADVAENSTRNRSYGLTAPLVTKADGGKFGKTETGAVWLTAERTSPYAYYQFWLNADDRDVERFLKIFTLLTQDEIASFMALHAADPGARHAHRALAQAATTLLHGEAEMHRAEAAAKALFSGEVAALDKATLAEAFASAPMTTHKRSELSAAAVAPVAAAPGSDGGGGQSSGGAPGGPALRAGRSVDEAPDAGSESRPTQGADTGSGAATGSASGKSLVDLLVETGLAKSKREAREFLQNGSIALNGSKVGPDDRLTPDRLLHGEVALLRRGKKQWHLTRWE